MDVDVYVCVCVCELQKLLSVQLPLQISSCVTVEVILSFILCTLLLTHGQQHRQIEKCR